MVTTFQHGQVDYPAADFPLLLRAVPFPFNLLALTSVTDWWYSFP